MDRICLTGETCFGVSMVVAVVQAKSSSSSTNLVRSAIDDLLQVFGATAVSIGRTCYPGGSFFDGDGI